MLDDEGTFSVARTLIGVAAVSQNETSSPCHDWESLGCLATGGLHGGQWFLEVELRIEAALPSARTFVVSVQLNSDGPILQPITFTTTDSTTVGSTGGFRWDLGSSFNMPLAFTVTVTDA
jgi:hypothetical protein